MKKLALSYIRFTLGLILLQICILCSSQEEKKTTFVKIAGAMRNVMQMGDLSATINLDTVGDKANLYGVGPMDSLKGELLILDGRSYVSVLTPASEVSVDERFDVKAPFFVYANVNAWDKFEIPDSVSDDTSLDSFLSKISVGRNAPFAFKFTTRIDTARIHVVNFPRGSTISSPEDTHRGQKDFVISKTDVEVIGFFSKKHQGVFTHHDSNIHMHLITSDRKSMGHVDGLKFEKGGMMLYVSQ